MPTDQNNDRYPVNVPRGGEPYDQYINRNFDSLATDVPKSGPIADRPDASNEYAPDRYYATDEGVEYWNTGASWTSLPIHVDAESYNGFRAFSSFSDLASAVDWSDSNDSAVFIDGQFTITESNIALKPQTRLFGIPNWSRITVDIADTTDPLFYFQDATRYDSVTMEGIRFHNERGNTRGVGSFVTSPGLGSGDYISPGCVFRDLFLTQFNGTYVMEITDAYNVVLDNIQISYHNGGGIKLDRCNASRASRIGFAGNSNGDGTTPMLYIVRSRGLSVDHIYSEFANTDAIIQVADNSDVIVTGGYVEANGGSFNSVIQVGDGGLTEGNTEGTTNNSSVSMYGMAAIGGGGGQAVRVFAGAPVEISNCFFGSFDHAIATGNSGGQTGYTYTLAEGSARNIRTNVASTIIVQENDSAKSNFIYHNANIYGSRPAVGDLAYGERALGFDTGGSTYEMYYRDHGGSGYYWTADGTL